MSGQSYSYLVKIGDRTYNALVKPSGESKFKVVVDGVEMEVLVEAKQPIVKMTAEESLSRSAEVKSVAGDAASRPIDSTRKQESSSGAVASSTPQTATPTTPITPAVTVGGAIIASPIPGKVLKVLTAPGDTVSPGKLVATLESMKMEVEVFSDKSGRVKEVKVRAGDFINVGDPLVVLE
ncbi:MAG: biotin/lipoyl-containing protein [Sulfolobales archaeon]|nr:biotin/lipoyl-binding protein [Sulfolobales archaeon]MDW8082356.1 biotin/lipoyl-containing protein [Sulfolobales archaeon]